MSFLIASGHVEVEARTDKAKSAITGLIGTMGALGPVAGAAAASLASAGAGVAAFGVAAGKQIASLKKAQDAQSKYQEAVDKSGRGSQEAAKAQLEYQRVMARMPRATQEATVAFQSLKDSYDQWSDSLAADTMPVFTKSFAVFQAMLPKTTGLVQGTSRELDRMVTLIAGGVASPGFDRFMVKLENLSTSTLHSMTNGLLDLSQSLGSFAAGGGFDDFVQTAKEAGPLLGSTLANLAELALNLTAAGGDLGITMLTVANALAEMANAIPPGVLANMVQLYATLKLVSLGVAGLSAVVTSSAVARLAAYFTLMRAAGVAPTLRATAASMTAVQKAGIGLGVLAVGAIAIDKLADKARGAPPDVDRLATSLKNLAATGKVTGELRKSFGSLDGLAEDFKKLKTAQEEVAHQQSKMSQTELFNFKNRTNPVGDWFWGMIDDFQKGEESAKALDERFGALDEAFARLTSSGHGQEVAKVFGDIREKLRAAGYSDAEINKTFDNYKAGLADLKAEQRLAAAGMGIFGQQALATKAKLDAQKTSADGLRASILALNDVNRSAYDAQIQFEAGIDALTASFKENGATLDLNTEAGRKNGQMMSQAAKGHDEMVASGLAAGESLASMTSKSDQLRSTMMELATKAFGGNTKAATEYVNKLLGIPSEVKTLIKAERAEAITGLQAVQAAIKATPGAKSIKVDTLNAAAIKALEAVGYKTRTLEDGRTEVFTKNGQAIGSIGAVRAALDRLDGKRANTYTTHTVTTHYRVTGSPGAQAGRKSGSHGSQLGYARGGRVRGYAGGGEVQAFPSGGYVAGPGSGTSDSILALMGSGAAAMVSNTEYVMRAAAVAKYGVGFMDAVNSGRLRLPGFAKGGKLTEKQKAELQRRNEARSFLKGNATLSDMSIIAGVQNAEISSKLGKERSEGALVDFLNQLQTQVSKAGFSKGTNAALQKQITSSAKKLFTLNDSYDKVSASLEKAKSSLDDLKGKFDNLKTSVSSSLVGFGNITKLGKYGTSADTLINQLRSDTGRTTEFAKQLEQLKAKGLNATAIGNIAQAGVTGGGMATAQSLLNATPQQIAEINALQKQLEASANKAGTVTADAMYGAGIKAAEGLVKGLTAQQSAIEAAMMTIAKAMEKSIKKALGIKSPAKVMEPIGDFAFQGVETGWVKRMAQGNTLLTGSTAGLRTKPTMPRAAVPTATAAGAAPANITVHVHSTDLMTSPAERKRVAGVLAKDINDALLDYQKGRRR
ncbi:hypothetical protein ACIPIC_18340 [Streptomyces collinus]|uniref:hypothetical protein n=1 Tax=Streptomyces collinus TaxID=42684 RepID=UPI0037F2D725